MKTIAKIIVWIIAAPGIFGFAVLFLPFGIMWLRNETDWIDSVPNDIVVIASLGGEVAWLYFLVMLFIRLTGG